MFKEILKSKYLKIAAVVIVVIVFFMGINAFLSPQYALFKMSDAAEKNNVAEFSKYYAVHQPKAMTASMLTDTQKQERILGDYKDKYYQHLSLKQALLLNKRNESIAAGTVSAGTLLFVRKGQQTVAYRMVRQNGTWQVVDIAKINGQL